GVTRQDKGGFMWGVAYLIVWAIGKYIYLVNDYLTSAFMMMALGVGTYFINKLWDKRYEK
ncbi:MAG: hypothetical protein EAZ97_05255, partial [Bacteroidetes bacterium]